MSTRPKFLILIAAMSVACTARAGISTSPDLRYSGRIASVGTEGMPMVTLALDDGSAVNLAGALVPELERLAGARLTVHGVASTHAPAPAVDVLRYDILEVNGQKPWVGVLVQRDNGYALAEGEAIVTRLDRPPSALTSQLGARVWVTGSAAADGVRVQSFGVIRPGG